MPAKRPASAVPPHEFNGEFGELTERSEVDIKSPAVSKTGELSEVAVSTGSSTQCQKEQRGSSVEKRKVLRAEAGSDQVERSPAGTPLPVLHDEALSDDLFFGEDEVDGALPDHVTRLYGWSS